MNLFVISWEARFQRNARFSFIKGVVCRWLLWTWLGVASLAAELDPKAAVLNMIRSVRELAAIEADQHLPVRLVGVLTFVDWARPACFLQDDSDGVYLEFTNSPSLKAGQQVRVVGATAGGGFTPIVTVGSIVGAGSRGPRSAQASFVPGIQDGQVGR